MAKTRKQAKEEPALAGCKLATELKFYGCDADPGDFNDTLAELHHAMHPGWSPEQLLYRPTYAITFVKAVRERSRDTLPEEMILRRLRNIQKAGQYNGR